MESVIWSEFNRRWIPESARWLLANGKVERAQFYLRKCAKFNKRQVSSKFELEVSESTTVDPFIRSKNSKMLRHCTWRSAWVSGNFSLFDCAHTWLTRKWSVSWRKGRLIVLIYDVILTNNPGQGISCSVSDSLARCYKYEAPLSAPVQTLSNIKLLDKQDKNYSYLDLIKTPELRKRTLLTGIMW